MRPLAFAVLGLLFPGWAWAQVAPRSCTAPDALATVDHVVLAVADLQAASGAFRDLGFTLKEGRLHPNGLRNRHVKFAGAGDVELMTVEGEPGDPLAQAYRDFLDGGDGGAYLALGGAQTVVLEAAGKAGIAAEASGEGSFRYVTFPEPALKGVFTVAYATPVRDTDADLRHANGAWSTREVWVEGGAELERLLRALGARACGDVLLPQGGAGAAYGVGDVAVVVLPRAGSGPPRVVGLVVSSRGATPDEEWGTARRIHGVWITLAPARDTVPRDPLRSSGGW